MKASETLHIALGANAMGQLIMPWINYMVQMPIKPMPPVPERPRIRTKRLLVRPITMDDLEPFHELRRQPETQNHCGLFLWWNSDARLLSCHSIS